MMKKVIKNQESIKNAYNTIFETNQNLGRISLQDYDTIKESDYIMSIYKESYDEGELNIHAKNVDKNIRIITELKPLTGRILRYKKKAITKWWE